MRESSVQKMEHDFALELCRVCRRKVARPRDSRCEKCRGQSCAGCCPSGECTKCSGLVLVDSDPYTGTGVVPGLVWDRSSEDFSEEEDEWEFEDLGTRRDKTYRSTWRSHLQGRRPVTRSRVKIEELHDI